MTIGSNANYPTYRAAPVRNAGTITNNTAVDAAYAIQISASATANVTLTLEGGGTIIVHPAVGDNIYPYAVTKAVVNSGTVTDMYNLS